MQWSVNFAWTAGISYFGMWQDAQSLFPTVHPAICVAEGRTPSIGATLKALFIIGSSVAHQWLVRIMTGDARNPCITLLPPNIGWAPA